MVNVGQATGSWMSGSPFSIVIIIVGTLIALVAFPQIRQKISNVSDAPRKFFYGPSKEEVVEEAPASVEEDKPASRPEIDDFDLNYFKIE